MSVSELKPFRIIKNKDRSIAVLIVIAAPVFKIKITVMEMYKTPRRKKLN